MREIYCKVNETPQMSKPEWIPENELTEIVLKIRQYLCNTEFAPEPFTKPVDIDILKVQFPNQIFDCVLNAVVKWLFGTCPHNRGDFRDADDPVTQCYRHACGECMEELRLSL